MPKRIVITGATGLIGRKVVSALSQREDEVVSFSRNTEKAKSLIPSAKKFVEWDYRKPENWQSHLENVDAVIHLAGSNLFAKRWNNDFKREILDSRQGSTKKLVDAIISCIKKPKVFITASGIDYYGNTGNKLVDENSPAGNDFLADVCKVWESEAKQVESVGVRSVQVRTGLILSKDDGALKQMLPPFKFFIGGPLGNGKQWASWLHIDDIVGIYLHAIDNQNLNGAVNAVSPNPVKMNEFASTLGKVLNRPSLFPVPKFVLKLVVGEAAGVITASHKIDNKKIVKSGYKFKFENLEITLQDLLKQKRT